MSYSSAAVLQMPSSYVPMSTEEMEYVEGGYYLSKRTCQSICSMVCLSPVAVATAYVGVSLATKMIKGVAASIGGVPGYVAGVLISAGLTYASTQIITFAKGIIAGAKYNGVDFGFEISLKNNRYGVYYSA